MAHCVWMEDEELRLLKDAQTGVSHCPSSNLNIHSGHCDVKRLLEHGLKVGLGTGEAIKGIEGCVSLKVL